MTDPLATQAALDLVDRSPLLMVTTMNDRGYPETRVMFAMGHEALKTFWFSTHTSSRKVAQVQADPRACVCAVDMADSHGLSLVGRVEVPQDAATKKRLWREGFERFFPLGASDPDYCVLRFDAEQAKYSHGPAGRDAGPLGRCHASSSPVPGGCAPRHPSGRGLASFPRRAGDRPPDHAHVTGDRS